jgi:hypothetical protein
VKTASLLFALSFCAFSFNQQQTQLPHGIVFGAKPDTIQIINAPNLEIYIAKKTRVNATIRGKVLKVTKQKGGWFEIDAGKGKIVTAHFKNYNVTIPADLGGRTVIAEGTAAKQFIADDQQHYAGGTTGGKKQHNTNANPKRRLTFEVKGLFVE